MSEIKYNLKPETKKPSRKYRKGSKYDPILEAFEKGTNKMVSVSIEGKDANYIRTQLKKRLDVLENKSIAVSVVNNTCFLDKGKTEKPHSNKPKELKVSEPDKLAQPP